MTCAECDRLRAEYERWERRYADAINALNARRETAPSSEYMKLRAVADEARIDAELARLELDQHQRVHRKAN